MDQFGSYTFTFIPLTTAQLLFNHSDPSVGQTYLSVKDIDTDQKMAEFEQRLRNRLAAEHTFAPDDESAVWIYNRMEGYKNMMLVFGGINLFIWIIGLGTLLAGIVGVSNIMLVTVQERTFEFGIRKALGAKPSSIIRLILTESVMITAAFGYIGMVLGVFAMEGVNKLMTQTPPGEENTFNIFVNPTLNLSVAVSATIVLVLAGLIAGYIPPPGRPTEDRRCPSTQQITDTKTAAAGTKDKRSRNNWKRETEENATAGDDKPGKKIKETPATPVRNHPGVRRTTKVPSRGGIQGRIKLEHAALPRNYNQKERKEQRKTGNKTRRQPNSEGRQKSPPDEGIEGWVRIEYAAKPRNYDRPKREQQQRARDTRKKEKEPNYDRIFRYGSLERNLADDLPQPQAQHHDGAGRLLGYLHADRPAGCRHGAGPHVPRPTGRHGHQRHFHHVRPHLRPLRRYAYGPQLGTGLGRPGSAPETTPHRIHLGCLLGQSTQHEPPRPQRRIRTDGLLARHAADRSSTDSHGALPERSR